MAALPLRLWWLAAALLLWTPSSKAVTIEDIRDGLISIVHVIKQTDQRLDRHEYREKNLEIHIRKMLAILDRKHRELDPVKGMISRLDERLSNVETILLHRDDRDKSTQAKTNEVLDGIKKSIESLTTSVQNLSNELKIKDNDTTNDDSVEKRLDMTDSKIDHIKDQIADLRKTFNKEVLPSKCLEVPSDKNPFDNHFKNAEQLLNKFVTKLNEFNATKAAAEMVSLNEVTPEDEAWHSNIHREIESQGKEIAKMHKILSEAEGVWKELPKLTDLQAGTNQTLEAIVRSTANSHGDTGSCEVNSKLRELGDRLVATNQDVQFSLTQGNTLLERSLADIRRQYDTLHQDVKSLSKSDQVILKTADDVISNKNRIEYSVYQIVSQIKEIVLSQGGKINASLADRIDRVEASIMGNEAMLQVNLSATIADKMASVWRQVGIMHEQLKATKETLDQLNERNDNYVNSSTTTMGKVKDVVTSISGDMGALTENLNYALGRLGLVTHEFSQISAGLAEAMTGLKDEVQAASKQTDAGPGPHKIPSAEISP